MQSVCRNGRGKESGGEWNVFEIAKGKGLINMLAFLLISDN